MSGRTDWCDKPLPLVIRRRYPPDMLNEMSGMITSGAAEWRFTGTNHFEVRHIESGKRIMLTAGKTAANPSYAAKWRSFCRKN